MMSSLFATAVMILLSAFAFAEEPTECNQPGMCEGELLTAVPEVASALDCLVSCKDDPECNFYTYTYSSGICLHFADCPDLSVDVCPDCVSGSVNCTEKPCFAPGKCVGDLVDFDVAFDEGDCRKMCLANQPDCEFFTFDTTGDICYLTVGCEVVDCPTCVHGEWDCELQYQGLSKLLVVGGNTGTSVRLSDTEIVDLEVSEQTCRDPPDYPLVIEALMAATVKNVAWFCGGYPYTDQCYTYNGTSNAFTPARSMLEARDYSGAAMVKGGTEWWITGGANATFPFMDSTEFLKDGSDFVYGPDLPVPTRGHCLLEVNNTHVFLAGGDTETGRSNLVYITDLSQSAGWTPMKEMPVARAHFVCGKIVTEEYGEEIVVTGGGSVATEYFSLANYTWRTGGPNFPWMTYHSGTVPYNGTLLVIGGEYAGTIYDTIHKLDTTADEQWRWEEKTQTLGYARYNLAAVMLRDEETECP